MVWYTVLSPDKFDDLIKGNAKKIVLHKKTDEFKCIYDGSYICTYYIPPELVEKYKLSGTNKMSFSTKELNLRYLNEVYRTNKDICSLNIYNSNLFIDTKLEYLESNKERLRAILMSDNIMDNLAKGKDDYNALMNLIPELNKMVDFHHFHPHHFLTIWGHTRLALRNSPKDFNIRLALLLHDISKPFVYKENYNVRKDVKEQRLLPKEKKDEKQQYDKGLRHYNGHPAKSAEMSEIILKRLNFNDEYIKFICYLIKNHDTKLYEDIECNNNLVRYLVDVQECDALAHNQTKLKKRQKCIEDIRKKLR